MIVPTKPDSYNAVPSAVGAPINQDISVGWLNATSYEVAYLPPDITYDAQTTSIVGTATTRMNYKVSIRGVNFSGDHGAKVVGEWKIQIYTTTDPATTRVLFGLDTNWQLIQAAGLSSVVFIKQATRIAPGNFSHTGRLLINDIENEGNASIYPSTALYSQILLSGASNTYVRASELGWELVVDNAQVP